MLKALKNLVWGAPGAPLDPNAVTEEEFGNAVSNVLKNKKVDFLVILPAAKLSYRIKDGQFAGKSYMWLLAQQTVNGNYRAMLTVCQHITIDDLRTKPNGGPDSEQTVLWLLAYAASRGFAAPLLEVLRKCGSQLTDEDLDVQTMHYSVRQLMLCAPHSKIKHLVPGLANEGHYKDDDSCNSAGTLKNDSSQESTDNTCRSTGTLADDDDTQSNDDDDEKAIRAKLPTTLRMYSSNSRLKGSDPKTKNMPAPAAPVVAATSRHKR